MPLRPYQTDIYNQIPILLKEFLSVLIQAPARSGKSHIISATAERIINTLQRLGADRAKIPLVLTHRNKIQSQLIKHCNGISIDANVDHIFIQPGMCYVAMHQTLIKRQSIIDQLKEFGSRIVLIVDEAHRGDFNKMFDTLPAALRIGFSATPAWKWAKFIPTYYKSFIHGPQVMDLTEKGNIVPIEYFEMQSVDLSGLKKSNNGEFTEESQWLTFDRAKLYDGLFVELKKFTFNKCVVFCASKKSADSLYKQFIEDAHYRVTVYYSGKKPYELAKFTELDQANVLITIRSLSEGWDYTAIDMNVLWSAFGSLPLYLQAGARGATPHPGKLKTTVLDFGGNNSRFGGKNNIQALTMDRDWYALSRPPEEPPRLSNGVAAIKNCPCCDFIISALAKSCSNCGYIYPVSDVELKEGELIKIEHNLEAAREAATQLAGRRVSTLTAQELAVYAKERDKKSFCMRVAKSRELTAPGFIVDYGKEMGYSGHWSTRILKDQAEVRSYDPDYKIEYFDVIVK